MSLNYLLNKDIKEGLNQIMMGGDDQKFANKALAVKLFLQRTKKIQRWRTHFK